MNGAPLDVIELTQVLASIDSVNPGLDTAGEGESEIAHFIANWATAHGLRVEIIEPTPGRPSVVIRGGRNRGGRRLLLCGHLDTVSLAGHDDGLAPRVEGDRLYGRGVYDMKAGLAAAMVACYQADRSGIDGEVLVAAVADEEHASVGVQEVLEHLHRQIGLTGIDAAVVNEPTEQQIGSAHRGFVWTEVTVVGVAAHGSRPHLGADAIAAAGRYLVAFEEFDRALRQRVHPFLGFGNLHASRIGGGTEESTIPARCVFTIERRILPHESLDLVEADVAHILENARCSDPRITASARTLLYRPAMQTAHDATIVRVLTEVIGPEAVTAPLSYWADSALISAAGVPTVLYGPDGDGAHADAEWVSISGTRAVAGVLSELSQRFCTGASSA